MAAHTPHRLRTPKRTQGFALIVSLSLMAFIVLLLVSLITLVQSETRANKQQMDVLQARMNARFGLMVAVGNLQKYAGPDQRVTARADILKETKYNDPNDYPDAVSDFTVNVSPQKQQWIGVWEANRRTEPTSDPGAHELVSSFLAYASDKRKAVPKAWLVSGVDNEDVSNVQDVFESTLSIPTFTDFKLKPSEYEDFALLVGSGSVDVDLDESSAVIVPLESIEDQDKVVRGKYAWWVSDESLKAKYNLVEHDNFSTSAYQLRNVAPTTNAIDAMSEFDSSIYDKYNTTFKEKLKKVIAWSDISVAEPILADVSAPGESDSPMHRRYHDLTLHSLGLLTDTQNGGLKEDLSVYLFHGNVGSVNDGDFIYSDKRSGVVPFEDIYPDLNWGLSITSDGTIRKELYKGANHNLPRFGVIRDWANLSASPKIKSHQSEEEDTGTPDPEQRHAFHPVVVNVQVPMSVALEKRVDQYRVLVAYHPRVLLWNPYDVALPANDYLMGLNIFGSTTSSTIYITLGRVSDGSSISGTSAILDVPSVVQPVNNSLDVPSGVKGSSSSTGRIFMEFKDLTLAPGEVAIFSANTTGGTLIPGEDQLVEYSEALPMVKGGSTNFESDGGIVVPTADFRDPTIVENNFPFALRLRGVTVGDTSHHNTQPYFFFFGDNDGDWDLLQAFGTPEHTLSTQGTVSETITQTDAENISLKRFNETHAVPAWSSEHSFPFYFSMRTIAGKTRTAGKETSSADGEDTLSFRRGMGMYNVRGNVAKHPYAGMTPEGYQVKYDTEHSLYYTNASPYPETGDYELGNHISSFELKEAALFATSSHAPNSLDGEAMPIFHIPQSPADVISLGQLQHVQFLPSANAPSYVMGNANAHPMIARENYSGLYDDSIDPRYPDEDPPDPTDDNFQNSLHDASLLVNDALWDRFFLSGIEDSLTANQLDKVDPLPNPRLMPVVLKGQDYSSLGSNLDRFERGAEYLGINGAFNVNSTSVEAWVAMLSSLNEGIRVGSYDADSGAAFPRLPLPVGDEYSPGSGGASEALAYSGFRILEEDELRVLAQRIVEQVKLRGPFLSLSDFVNRRLIEVSKDLPDEHGLGLRGALKAAIDRSTIDDSEINDSFWTTHTKFAKDHDEINYSNRKPKATPAESELLRYYFDLEHTALGEDEYTTAEGIPGFLTQADILQKIGSFIRVRGDTFKVRAYGNVTNPVNQEIMSEAWCEIVVQRTAEEINPTIGRRFQIISFRWLKPDDV